MMPGARVVEESVFSAWIGDKPMGFMVLLEGLLQGRNAGINTVVIAGVDPEYCCSNLRNLFQGRPSRPGY